MGDPLSICSDPAARRREMHRITKPGGIVIATADNKLAALDHFVERGNLDALEEFINTGRTNWLTADERERFELTTFTPASLRKLFEKSGFEVIDVAGKTIIPVQNKRPVERADAIQHCCDSKPTSPKTTASAATRTPADHREACGGFLQRRFVGIGGFVWQKHNCAARHCGDRCRCVAQVPSRRGGFDSHSFECAFMRAVASSARARSVECAQQSPVSTAPRGWKRSRQSGEFW